MNLYMLFNSIYVKNTALYTQRRCSLQISHNWAVRWRTQATRLFTGTALYVGLLLHWYSFQLKFLVDCSCFYSKTTSMGHRLNWRPNWWLCFYTVLSKWPFFRCVLSSETCLAACPYGDEPVCRPMYVRSRVKDLTSKLHDIICTC